MNNQSIADKDKRKKLDANRDPLTGKAGSHPLGTGVGAAGGAVAGAAVGSLAGPVGAGVGLVAGAITGGLAGKKVAEEIDPTAEEAYWKNNYTKQSYVDSKVPYASYQTAYRMGYEGRMHHPGKKFEDVEVDIRRDYEKSKAAASLDWEKARPATRAAWNRVS